MNTSDAPSGNHLLLPRLKDKSDIKAGNPGQWEIRNRTAFEGVAKSLDYEAPGLTRGISSVPTLWARPLLVEMTLHDESNPLHQDMVGQWRGMLAAIALAHLRNFPLKIRLLELIKLQGQQEFGEALLDLIPPARRNNLYELPEDRTVSGNPNLSRNPWQDLYLLFWNDRPVGTTSPSTFVVPSEEADWSGLPWWIFDNNRSRLQSPERFLNDDEKQLLWLWLDQLGENLPGVQPFATPASRLHTLIANFQAVLKEPDSSSDINTYLQRDDYFGLRLNRGCLGLLGRPLKGNESRESSLQLQGIQGGDDVPLVILDNQISDQWGVPTQSLYVFQGETLAYFLNPDGTINGDRLKTKQQEWGQQVRCVTLADLFSPRLTFLDGAPAELLPNALFPPGMRLLWEGSEFTPLIPLNSLLLDYLSPQTLSQALRFDTLNTGQGPALKVSVTLQLTGLDGQGQACTLSQVYRLDSGNRLPDVPVLDIWPNFRAHQPTPDGGFKTWQHYYAFYCDSRYGDRTFKVTVPNLSREADATHCYMDAGQQFQISRLTDFPPYIQCQNNSTGEDIGLILLTVPEVMTLTKSWDVGVDFGTSFTNIYVNPEGNALPSQLSLESVNYKVTKSLELDRKLALVEYFMDDTFAPEDLSPLPLSSVVTSRKSRTGVDRDLHQSVIDGRIYIPDNRTFDPRLDYIKTGLKLNSRDDENDRRLFLEHLALHITAMAAKAGVRSITWHASYPSAFSRNERRSYEDRWRTLPETLTTTGLDHQFRGLKTEALAVGQYFQDFEGTAYDLLRTTCLDMGGGTSDISIWNDRTLVHQCSVQLAGRDLFTEVLKVKPGFVVNRIIKSLDKGQNKATDLAEWDNLSQVAFNAKLDSWARWSSEEWLKRKRSSADFEDDAEFQGLVTIIAIGFGGLFYYVGQILKTLHQEGRYPEMEITPVYLAGSGSRLLHWLDPTGRFEARSEFNGLLSRMISCGSVFQDTQKITRLSPKPKHESACGLVVSRTKLTGLEQSEDYLVAGEVYSFGQSVRLAEGRVQFDPEYDDIASFAMSDLEQLPKFLADFHQALRELRIDSIYPLSDYNIPKPHLEDNPKLWQQVRRQLGNTILDLKQDRRQNRARASQDVRIEPPFILALRSLLVVLAQRWTDQYPD